MTPFGARINATTSKDRTNFFATLPLAHLDDVMKIEADRMQNARIRIADKNSEMSVVRNEFEIGENDPYQQLDTQTYATAFTQHSYHHSTIGARDDIEQVPISALQNFYKTFYNPENAALIIAGKFNIRETLELVVKNFVHLTRNKSNYVFTSEGELMPPPPSPRTFETAQKIPKTSQSVSSNTTIQPEITSSSSSTTTKKTVPDKNAPPQAILPPSSSKIVQDTNGKTKNVITTNASAATGDKKMDIETQPITSIDSKVVNTTPKIYTFEPQQQGARFYIIKKAGITTPILTIAFKKPPSAIRASIYVGFVAKLLGEGKKSFLYKQFVQKEKLFTSVEVQNESVIDTGLVQFFFKINIDECTELYCKKSGKHISLSDALEENQVSIVNKVVNEIKNFHTRASI